MSTGTAQLELPASAREKVAVEHTVAEDVFGSERPLSLAKAIVTAALISTPFWALFAIALYLLV